MGARLINRACQKFLKQCLKKKIIKLELRNNRKPSNKKSNNWKLE